MQIATLDPAAPDYDPAAAEALLADLGYGGFDLIDPAAPDYGDQYSALLADLSALATNELSNQLLLSDYFSAQSDADAAMAALMQEGQTLSPAALEELHSLLGLSAPCPAEDPLCASGPDSSDI